MRPLKGHPKPTGEKCQLPDRQIPQDIVDQIKKNDLTKLELKMQAKKRFTEKRKKLSGIQKLHFDT